MCHPLSWSSKRIRRVVKSTLAAETLALQDGLDDAFYIMELYQFILGEKIGITAITDSLSLYNAVYSSKVVEEKRLRIDISSIKELIEKKVVKSLQWVDSKRQLADCMTKRTAIPENLLQVLRSGRLPTKL